MKFMDRVQLALRLIANRSVQTADKYVSGVHVVQTQRNTREGAQELEHVEPFGFASRPGNGAEHIVLSLGGDRTQSVVIMAHNRQYKFALNEGEMAIYNEFGDHVHLKDNGEAHVKASTKVFAETPLFETSADCLIGGNLVVNGTSQLKQTTTVEAGNFVCAASAIFNSPAGFVAGITANGTNIGESHDHTYGNEGDGSTGPVR
ncbi:MAG: hypothetical protein C9356_12520 [Oleiphilus sp.]|nr:MAG: hypothetical protein C9356_12520 [Oleiphilus sp.]